MLAAAQAEVRERQEVKDEIGEVEQRVLSSLGHQVRLLQRWECHFSPFG